MPSSRSACLLCVAFDFRFATSPTAGPCTAGAVIPARSPESSFGRRFGVRSLVWFLLPHILKPLGREVRSVVAAIWLAGFSRVIVVTEKKAVKSDDYMC